VFGNEAEAMRERIGRSEGVGDATPSRWPAL
jgi:hypothetical protein